jgi:hypothetical protein
MSLRRGSKVTRGCGIGTAAGCMSAGAQNEHNSTSGEYEQAPSNQRAALGGRLGRSLILAD